MSRTVTRTYVTPLKSDGSLEVHDGSETTFATGRGVFTLAALTTYYFPLPVGASSIFDCHLTHDAVIVLTSAKIASCSHAAKDVSDVSVVGGEWIDQDPSTAFVGTVGAGTTATNGVAAVAGGTAGGCNWLVSGFGAERGRLEVVVGATGGEVRVSFTGKE
jgi:hypothetical protein